MKKFIMTLAMLPMLAFAGQDGSGGSGICVNGRCKTLAEVGFRPLPASAKLEVSVDVIEELIKVQNILPPLFEVKYVIGEPGDIQFVQTANADLVKKFLVEYRKVLADNNSSLLSKDKA